MRVEKIFNFGQNNEKIVAQFHTFVEIDREIIYTVILLSFAESFKKGFLVLIYQIYLWAVVFTVFFFSLSQMCPGPHQN